MNVTRVTRETCRHEDRFQIIGIVLGQFYDMGLVAGNLKFRSLFVETRIECVVSHNVVTPISHE